MDAVLDILTFVGHAIDQALLYIESHHWIFGFLAVGYFFYLHDRGLHSRLMCLSAGSMKSAKRLAVEY